jgi:antitoxin (DNA-binding transcriptional repressor) of toxin-antitoxin stability system
MTACDHHLKDLKLPVVSSDEVSIEYARRKLGDLVNHAHIAGGITYVTRNGTRVAAIVPLSLVRAPDAAADIRRRIDAMPADCPGCGAVLDPDGTCFSCGPPAGR